MNHKDAAHSHVHGHSSHGLSDKKSIEQYAGRLESEQRNIIEPPQKVIQFTGDVKGKTLIDIGAGTGYYALKFAHKGAHVIAADVNEELQAYLKRKMEKLKIKNVELRKSSPDDPRLHDEEADFIFMANTYHHVENRTDYFAQVKKGLKADGQLIVLDYFSINLPKGVTAPPMEMRVSVDQTVFELKNSGFTNFEVEVNLLPYHYLIRAK